MKSFETEQERFWAGNFGNEYIQRNCDDATIVSKIGLFSKILSCIPGGNICTCLELGSNIGLNLRVLHMLLPEIKSVAVEINQKAAEECAKIPSVKVVNDSIFNFRADELFDLTFVSGVLIHINPDMLPRVYDTLYNNSKRYILINEYYNPTPVEVSYRGNEGKLFKRDFAGEFLDRFPSVELINYGFSYHRDHIFPSDDATWFLMEKK